MGRRKSDKVGKGKWRDRDRNGKIKEYENRKGNIKQRNQQKEKYKRKEERMIMKKVRGGE